MKLYMFSTVPLSIIRSFSLYPQQWYMSYRFIDSYWAGSGFLSRAVYKPVWHIPLLSVHWITVNNSWWWTEELSETCRVSFQNKFEKLVHLVGFIIRMNYWVYVLHVMYSQTAVVCNVGLLLYLNNKPVTSCRYFNAPLVRQWVDYIWYDKPSRQEVANDIGRIK
jgi:hypothetical protein